MVTRPGMHSDSTDIPRDGPDGPWSSFDLGAGSNIQTFRGFPALSEGIYILPFKASWCENLTTVQQICERRGTYQSSDSTTYKEAGFHDAITSLSNFVIDGEPGGDYGLDSIAWGKSSIDPQFPEQYVVATVSRDFPLALYGIGIGSTRLSGGSEPIISPLEKLREQGIIPSLTYGYNAGSLYRKAYPLHRPRYRS
jgi:hypothetical protein